MSHEAADNSLSRPPSPSSSTTPAHTGQQIAGIFRVPRTTIYGHLDQNTVGSRPGTLTTPYPTGQ